MKKGLMIILIILLVGLLSTFVGNCAEAKGEIVVYSASGPEITNPIYELFNAKYPGIKFVTVYAGTPELFARFAAEKDNPAADVIFGGPPIIYDKEADLFEPYVHPEREYFATYDPNNIWQPYTTFCQPLMLNKKLIKPEEYPKTVKEVLDNGKKWLDRGGIALADPDKSSTGWTIVSGITSAYDWNFIENLLPYCKVTPGSDAMFSAIKDGEACIGWINEDLGVKWVNEGLPVELIYPIDVVTIQMDCYGLVKNGPNPELAKLFVNFLGSKEAHIITANIVKRRSVRKDVKPPGDLPVLGDLKLFYASEPREIVVAKFSALQQKIK